jgi:outer membrane protein TolC
MGEEEAGSEARSRFAVAQERLAELEAATAAAKAEAAAARAALGSLGPTPKRKAG